MDGTAPDRASDSFAAEMHTPGGVVVEEVRPVPTGPTGGPTGVPTGGDGHCIVGLAAGAAGHAQLAPHIL